MHSLHSHPHLPPSFEQSSSAEFDSPLRRDRHGHRQNPQRRVVSRTQASARGWKLNSLRLIGDAEAPNIIAQAVFSGHLAAREFDENIDRDETPFRVERVNI